jgi:predicted Rossmann fold nucleotide-binding protein DprA/Smf involved in DNA uptake
LSAGEFWSLCDTVGDPSLLAGLSQADIVEKAAVSTSDAERLTMLLGANTAFAFERERLKEEGVLLLSALDDAFPVRLRARLGTNCPSFLLVGGPADLLERRAIGVVGSRDAGPEALEVAAAAARLAAQYEIAVVSGLARGIDQAAMAAALEHGAGVVGVPTEGVRVVARSPEIRRRAHDGELCIASPYSPTMRFTAGNAMGRNKIVYALAEATLVVCSDAGSGGTWEGAREALRRGFGRVAVWVGEGAGLGNSKLIELGAVPISNVEQLLAIEPVEATPARARQASLFD